MGAEEGPVRRRGRARRFRGRGAGAGGRRAPTRRGEQRPREAVSAQMVTAVARERAFPSRRGLPAGLRRISAAVRPARSRGGRGGADRGGHRHPRVLAPPRTGRALSQQT